MLFRTVVLNAEPESGTFIDRVFVYTQLVKFCTQPHFGVKTKIVDFSADKFAFFSACHVIHLGNSLPKNPECMPPRGRYVTKCLDIA